MKKTILLVGALFAFMLCDAQVKTHSNYDVDGDGNVTVSDVTRTVNRVTEKLSDDRTVVDGESLNATLQEILSKLKSLDERIANLEKKNCTCSCSDGGETTDPYNGHEYVDLGLPSGLKWATCNIGANSPEEYGDYFAWGATAPQEIYDWVHTPYQTQDTDDYRKTKFLKYIGAEDLADYKDSNATDEDALKTVLDPEDDAAHVNWKGIWRMPTKSEIQELFNNSYRHYVTSYNNKDVEGLVVFKAKSNNDIKQIGTGAFPLSYSLSDPHIFFPMAGYCSRDSAPKEVNFSCRYWTSTLISATNPADFHFGNWDISYWEDNRYYAFSIRPVCP